MVSSVLLKSGTIVTASETFSGDIHIKDGIIASIGQELNVPGAEIVNVANRLVMPGGIDPHTHFDLSMFDTVSSDDHYTGHKAAAFGGTTTVLDFIPQDFNSLHEAVKVWHAKADSKAAVDFGFHMNITRFDKTVADEIPQLIEQGITTLKVFTAYNGRLRLQDGEIFQVMRIAKQHGMLTMLHAENGDVVEVLVSEALAAGHSSPEWHAITRPAWGAVESVFRGCSLAAQADAPLYIVHMNTAGGVAQAKYARSLGVNVMLETCPQYLFFTIEDIRREDGSKWICSPPMRTEADNISLWNSLSDGTIQTVATDHCPFFFDGTKPIIYEGNKVAIPGKELGREDFTKIPNGLPGVQDRMPILWTTGVVSGRLSENQFVALTSTNAAKIFGLYPRKGAIVKGADADLVVWDPKRRVNYGLAWAHQRTDYNLYEGWELIGYPEKVFLGGQMIVDRDQWLGRPGMGKYLYRDPHAEILL